MSIHNIKIINICWFSYILINHEFTFNETSSSNIYHSKIIKLQIKGYHKSFSHNFCLYETSGSFRHLFTYFLVNVKKITQKCQWSTENIKKIRRYKSIQTLWQSSRASLNFSIGRYVAPHWSLVITLTKEEV